MAEAPSSFVVLHDKPLTVEVVLGCWCPTMDLLAVVTEDGQLVVHRLNWQKLWLACPAVSITSICWRPDGKVLATGHQDGSTSLYNVEKCELFYRIPPLAGAGCVPHLSWVQAIAGPARTAVHQQVYQYRHMRFFSRPPFSTDPKTAPSVDNMSAIAPQVPWPDPPDNLNVLVSTRSSGHTSLYASGQVQLASLTPSHLAVPEADGGRGGQHSSVTTSAISRHQAYLSRDLRIMVSVTCAHDPSCSPTGDTTESSSKACASWAVVHSTGRLHEHRHQLHQLAVLSSLLTEMLEVVQAAIVTACKEWQSAQAELSKRLDQLKSTLKDHESGTGLDATGEEEDEDELVVGEFMCMLAAGHVSSGMHAFLTATLTEHGLRRLAKVVDSAVQCVHTALLDHVGPATEAITFLLGEMRGIAQATAVASTASGTNFHPLGMKASQCAEAEMECSKALLQIEALRLQLTKLGVQYRTFFSWLLKTLYQLEENKESAEPNVPSASAAAGSAQIDINTVVDFLANQFRHDCVLPDLVELTPQAAAFAKALAADGEEVTAPASLAYLASADANANVKAIMELIHRPSGPAEGGTEAAASSLPDSSVWPSSPLRTQLKTVATLCNNLFQQLKGSIEPGVQPLLKLPLLEHPFSATSIPRAPICCVSIPQFNTDPAEGPLWLSSVLPAPASPAQNATTILLLRIQSKCWCDAANPQEQAATACDATSASGRMSPPELGNKVQVEGALISLSAGQSIVDMCFYKGGSGQLAVLIQDEAQNEEPEDTQPIGPVPKGAASQLVLIKLSQLGMFHVPANALQQGFVEVCSAIGACYPLSEAADPSDEMDSSLSIRSRRCSPGSFQPPLVVSGPRRVAAVFSSHRRGLVLDLEDDDDAKDNEADEDDEADMDQNTSGEGGESMDCADEAE